MVEDWRRIEQVVDQDAVVKEMAWSGKNTIKRVNGHNTVHIHVSVKTHEANEQRPKSKHEFHSKQLLRSRRISSISRYHERLFNSQPSRALGRTETVRQYSIES